MSDTYLVNIGTDKLTPLPFHFASVSPNIVLVYPRYRVPLHYVKQFGIIDNSVIKAHEGFVVVECQRWNDVGIIHRFQDSRHRQLACYTESHPCYYRTALQELPLVSLLPNQS